MQNKLQRALSQVLQSVLPKFFHELYWSASLRVITAVVAP